MSRVNQRTHTFHFLVFIQEKWDICSQRLAQGHVLQLKLQQKWLNRMDQQIVMISIQWGMGKPQKYTE